MELIVFYFGFISLFTNFFLSYRQIIKHNSINNSNFFIFIYYKSFFKIFSYPFFLSHCCLYYYILSNNYNPDAGLYHYHSGLLNDSKIILGVTNINFTLGQSYFFSISLVPITTLFLENME